MAKTYLLRPRVIAPPVWSPGVSSSSLALLPVPPVMPERSEGMTDGAGLSKLHIVTDVSATSGKPAGTEVGGVLSLASGGSFLSLSRCGSGVSSRKEPAPRGRVLEWSPKSRMRLRYAMAGLDRAALGQSVFLTLTYPGEFPAPEDCQTYKYHLRHFTQALRREMGAACSGFWKLEFQSRGAAHYHILVVGYGGDLVALREWVARRWFEIVGSGDERHLRAGTQCDAARGVAGAMSYLAKYVSKADQTLPGNFSGRYWGRFNAEALPVAPVETLSLSPRDTSMLARWMRRIVIGHVMHARWGAYLRSCPLLSPDDGWTRLAAERAMKGFPVVTHSRRWKNIKTPEGRVEIPPGCVISHHAGTLEYPRPPRRWRLRGNATVRLIADADSFGSALQRAFERGLLGDKKTSPVKMPRPCGVLP